MQRKLQGTWRNRKILSIKVGDISQVNLQYATMLSNDVTGFNRREILLYDYSNYVNGF